MVFTCRPTSAKEEETCAAEIVKRLADAGVSAARRRPTTSQDAMAFYEKGRKSGDFESGIRMALQSMLDEPALPVPPRAGAGGDAREGAGSLSHQRPGSRVAAVVLPLGHGAGRRAAEGGRAPARCARRPGSRSRCAACSRIAARTRCRRASRRSGCGCRTSRRSTPTTCCSRSTTTRSPQAMQRETELFFDSIVREDRPVLDLLTADYTLRQRAARASTTASRTSPAASSGACTLPEYRRGLLGQGSILTLTSVADRTSPVQRGKWVMEVLLGSPPPPPPPNVPALDETKAAIGGKMLIDARAHGRAPQEPGVHVVPPRDRSARPRARELRRRPARGASRTTKCRSTRSASSTTAPRWTARRVCARRC